MSDFDKEAEREKLRKKFARDEEKRAETQRMSELLLKGATMTNKHCDQCSDPLFRYNGQTFCPSCQAANGEATPNQQPAESTQQPEPPHESTAEPTARAEPAEPQPPQTEPSAGQTPLGKTEAAVSRTPSGQPQPQSDAAPASRSSSPDPQSEGLATARQSLERTITRFARRAEETEDPRRARELLAAAREAAATLSELEAATA